MTQPDPVQDYFSRRPALGSWLLLVLCFTVYWPALNGGYIWDDIPFVVKNPLLQNTEGLFQLWFSHAAVDYWPVTYSSFWLERYLIGLNPFVSHVINCLLHGISAIFIWRILTRLHIHYAWLGALLFLIHPVNVDAVANIFQRKTVFAGALFFAAAYLWLRYREKPSWLLYSCALGVFILAVLSKSSALMLPPVLVVYLLYQHGRLNKQDILHLLPFFVVSIVLGVVGLQFQHQGMLPEGYSAGNWLERTSNAGHIITFYLSSLFWPDDLVFVYPRWAVTTNMTDYIRLAFILGLAILGVLFRHRWGAGLLFIGAFYLINLFPVLSFIEIIYFKFSWVADRFQYIAAASILGVLPHFVYIVTSRTGIVRTESDAQRLTVFLWAPIAIVMMILSWQQASLFQSEEKVWRHVVERYPDHWLSYVNLGIHLQRVGRSGEGEALLEKARQINPDNAVILYNLGAFATTRGDKNAAADYYRQAISIDETFSPAHNNLAKLLTESGRFSEAEYHYRQAIESPFVTAEIFSNLGEFLFKQKRFSEAEHFLLQALELNANLTEALNNLGALLIATSRPEEALLSLNRAISLKPEIAESYYLRGLAFDSLGQSHAAQQSYREALLRRPDWSAVKQRLKD